MNLYEAIGLGIYWSEQSAIDASGAVFERFGHTLNYY